MAVSGVKARLMMYESANAAASEQLKDSRPPKALPPVLQKFRQTQQQFGASNKEGTDPPVVRQSDNKWSRGTSNTTKHNGAVENSSVASSTATPAESAGKGGPGRLNISNAFLSGVTQSALKPVIQSKKPFIPSSNSNTSSGNDSLTEPASFKPKVALKPPAARLVNSSVSNTAPTSKPSPKSPVNSSISSSAAENKSHPVTSNGSNMFSGPVKLPSLTGAKPFLQKTPSSTSSASSASSTDSSKASSASVRTDNTSGPFDFRSQLRKTSGASLSTAEVSKNLPAGKITSASESARGLSAESPQESEPIPTPAEPADPPKRRSSSGDSSSKADAGIIERASDRKRFRRLDLSDLVGEAEDAPQKPQLPEEGVDLSWICQQHTRMVNGIASDEDDEEIYTEGISAQPESVEVRSSEQRSEAATDVNRVSMIPVMSAEEEGIEEEEEEIYDDGQTPIPEGDLLYVDAASESKPSAAEDEDLEEIYEDEGAFFEETEEDKKKRLKEEMEAKKKEEKKKKEEEKKKKQEEDKRKKEEKEEKRKKTQEEKRRKLFSLSGDETFVGEGAIKENAKARIKNSLAVKKGQIVTILRLNGNPSNMWLVKTDTEMGYVESSNIEIDPNIIRQAMMNGRKESGASNHKEDGDDDDQPLYDDVAAETPRSGHGHPDIEEEGDAEEIYECVQ